MGYFPFFVELKGKRGLIVGGGIVAEDVYKRQEHRRTYFQCGSYGKRRTYG